MEETLNKLLEQEAEKLTQAARYERSEARLRHAAGTQWGSKKYMNMRHLEAAFDDTSIAG